MDLRLYKNFTFHIQIHSYFGSEDFKLNFFGTPGRRIMFPLLCLLFLFFNIECLLEAAAISSQNHRISMARAWISFICANSKTIHSALNDHQHPHPLEDIVESFRARLAMPSGLNIDDHVDVTLERLQRALGRLEVIKNFEFIEKDDLLKELKGVSRKSLVLALHPKNSDLRVPLPLSPAEMLLLGEIPIGRGLLIPLVAGCACDLKMFFKHADLLKVHQFISLQSAVTVLWKEHINKSIHCQEDHLNSPLLEIPKAIHLATASDSARRTQMISAWVAKNILSDAKHSLAKSLMAGKIDGLTIDAYALLLAEASGISNNRIRAIPSTLFCDYLKYNQCPMIVWKHFERVRNQSIR